jgi:hypothetical protein
MKTRKGFSLTQGCGAAALVAAFLLPVAAGASTLNGDDIRSKVTGKRIYLATPFGGEFPLFYRTDGRVDGSGEAVGLGRFVRPTDSGTWWVSGDRLCQRWKTWYDGQVMCFKLTNVGKNQLRWEQDNGDNGLARVGN